MTPQEEIQVRQMKALQDAARFRGLLGNTPTPYARGLRPPTDAERARLDVTNPEMPLNDLARARLEAERPYTFPAPPPPDNPNYYGGRPYTFPAPPPPGSSEYGRFPAPIPFPFLERPYHSAAPPPPGSSEYGRSQQVAEEFFRRQREMGLHLPPPEFGGYIPNPTPRPPYTPGPYEESARLNAEAAARAAINPGGGVAADPEPEEYDGFVDSGTGKRGYLDFKYMPSPPPISGGGVAADPEPEEYDGFVNSGTGQRGYLDFKYMPTPMDTSVAMAQAAPVSTAQAAPPVANTAYNAPPVASTAYMPPPTDAPVNTAYMPSRRTVPVDTTYRPPASANTTYMPSPSPTYGMSTTPTYSMSNTQTTTPTYGGQMREPSFSPNQAGKYKVDGPRLRNTGGLFNDLNAFFGRPQT